MAREIHIHTSYIYIYIFIFTYIYSALKNLTIIQHILGIFHTATPPSLVGSIQVAVRGTAPQDNPHLEFRNDDRLVGICSRRASIPSTTVWAEIAGQGFVDL